MGRQDIRDGKHAPAETSEKIPELAQWQEDTLPRHTG